MPQLSASPYLLLLSLIVSGTTGAAPPAPSPPTFPDVELIDTVLKALQVFTAERSDHSGLVIIGNDSTRQWQRLSGLASVDVIRAQLEAMAMLPVPPAAPTDRAATLAALRAPAQH